jgi:hypothetical protein
VAQPLLVSQKVICVLISTVSIVIALLGLIAVTGVASRDHARLRAARRQLFDQAANILEGGNVSLGRDDFPTLDGVYNGARVRAELLPDTMTIRRLPQLWLSLTRFESRPGQAEFAMLVRPAGTEFYSLTSHFDHRLESVPELPEEIIIRGGGRSAQRVLDANGAMFAKICADPKVKEVGVTQKGLRIVWQADEGRRGEHLLLRQSQFDNASIKPADLERLLGLLDTLSAGIAQTPEPLMS